MPRVVFGLGNPGARYAPTRHNVGWRVVEDLVRRWGATRDERTATYQSWRGARGEHEVVLMVPFTFMNLCGEALRSFRDAHGLEADGVVVIADDVYLPIGSLRLRGGGSSGGHNGLESVEAALGTRDYARLRIGVGEVVGDDMREHVLGEPAGDDVARLAETLGLAADAVECWVGDGLVAAMNRYNHKVRKEVSES